MTVSGCAGSIAPPDPRLPDGVLVGVESKDAKFDLNVLAKSTKNWNGAEIEQCVVSAMVEAYAKERPLDEDELFIQIGKIVPLATTMSEQIKGIKSWAHDRAVRASLQVQQ